MPVELKLTRSLEVLRVSVNEGSGVDVTNAIECEASVMRRKKIEVSMLGLRCVGLI